MYMLDSFVVSVRALFCLFLIACCAFSVALANEHAELKKEEWVFNRPLGVFDRQANPKGF